MDHAPPKEEGKHEDEEEKKAMIREPSASLNNSDQRPPAPAAAQIGGGIRQMNEQSGSDGFESFNQGSRGPNVIQVPASDLDPQSEVVPSERQSQHRGIMLK